AVLVETADVAGAQPAVDQGLPGFLRTVQVAAHHVRAGDQHLAGFAIGHRVAVGAGDAPATTRQRQPACSGFALAVQRVPGTGPRALGESVPLDNSYAVTVFEPVQQFDAGRRRTAYGESQRRRVRGQVGGQVGEHRVDGRHSGEVGCPAAFDAAEEAPGVEPAGDCGAPTDEQRRQRAHHDSVDVEQRQDQQAVVRLGQTERVDHHLAHRVQVGVVEHDALG